MENRLKKIRKSQVIDLLKSRSLVEGRLVEGKSLIDSIAVQDHSAKIWELNSRECRGTLAGGEVKGDFLTEDLGADAQPGFAKFW